MKLILQILNSRIIYAAIALFMFALLMQTCHQSNVERKQFADNLRISRDSTRHFIDKTGQLVSEKETIQITVDDLKNQNVDLGIDKDNLKKQVGNLNNLVNYYKGKLVTSGQGQVKGRDTTIIVVDQRGDTVQHVEQKFAYRSPYLTFDATYDPVIDSLKFKYGYQVDFQLSTFYVRHKLFAKRQLFADVRLSDPKASMQNVQSILIVEPPKKWYETNWFYVALGASIVKLIYFLTN